MITNNRFSLSAQALLVQLVLLSATSVVTACTRNAEGALPKADEATPVRVATVTGEGSAEVSASGTLGAKDEIPLGFKIGGVVAQVPVDEGARVRAGTLLASLDLREIDAAVAKATISAEKTRRDAARVERLYHDSVATLAQFQDAQSAREAAEADLRAARVNREFAEVRAPHDGVVLRRIVNPGAQVAAGAQVALFASAERGHVLRAGLSDRDALRIHVGDAATVVFDAVPGQLFHGRVRQVGAAADARTGTYAVEVTLAGTGQLPSGLVGRVRITARDVRAGTAPGSSAANGALSIPAEALVEGDGTKGTVFVLDATRRVALRREVALLGLDGDRVRVRGLDRKSEVITAGAAWLRDSARVEIKP